MTVPLGSKFDSEKPRWSLVPWRELEDVVHVLTAGARKYSDGNWMHVENARDRYFSAAMRHLVDWQGGEKKDPETGRSHLSHAICCLLFISWFDKEAECRNPSE